MLDEQLGRGVGDIELGELVQVDRGVFHAERVVEALQFGDTLLQRHLATFEATCDLATTTGLLTLGTATGGLAALAADAATDALAGPVGTR